MLISELAKKADITVKTIYYYEHQGLIKEPLKNGRYRNYTNETLELLQFIRRCKNLGFRLNEIKTFCKQYPDLISSLPKMHTALRCKIKELTALQKKTEEQLNGLKKAEKRLLKEIKELDEKDSIK